MHIACSAFLSFLMLLPLAAMAHPHVFVDTKLRIQISDEGIFEGIEVAWTYDDFYSLLLLSDMGLTPDAKGNLEQSELVLLDGFDLQWVEGFAGDTIVSRDGTLVDLGPPEGRGIKVEDGLITSTHFRAATGPADGLVIKAFDPTFYTAYSLIGPVDVTEACNASIQPADLDAAYTMVEELLYATPSSQSEDDYPQVGEAFADTVLVSCKS